MDNNTGDDYYSVPFNISKTAAEVSREAAGTAVVILVDAEDGAFKEASWVRTAVEYLPISEDEAVKMAAEILEKLRVDPKEIDRAVVELVHISSTPYYPHWRITAGGYEILIGQDGTFEILNALSANEKALSTGS